MQDVYLAASAGAPNKSAIYQVMRAKSASYSVAWPLRAGAILAGQSAVVQQRIYALGIAVGTLFQIRDDELGTFGSAAKLGKPVDSDIREGKKTLLYYYLWRAATAAERRRLHKIFGNPEANAGDILTVHRLLRQYRVRLRLQEDIDQLKHSAMRQIDQLNVPVAAQRELQQLVEFCAQREV
jgi:geranylgeranyl diphosphate synthase type I